MLRNKSLIMLFLYKWQTFTVLLSQDFLRYWLIGRNSIKWRAAGHLCKVHVKLVKPSNLLSFLYYRHLHHSTVPKLNKRHANRIITGHSIKVKLKITTVHCEHLSTQLVTGDGREDALVRPSYQLSSLNPPGNWRRPRGRPRQTWLPTVISQPN